MSDQKRFLVGDLVQHERFGKGRIVGLDDPLYVVQFGNELSKVAMDNPSMRSLSTGEDAELSKLKAALAEVLGDYGWIETEMEMGKRWIGGTLKIVPSDPSLQTKEIPLDGFFKKVIGIREKLRVLEQKINNHPKLDPADKVELEAYITRCYGSLTTFNILFAHKAGGFKGSSTGGEE